MGCNVARHRDQDVPALIGVAPLAELPHGCLQHLIGVEARVLPEQRVRESRDEGRGRVAKREMACDQAAGCIDLPLAIERLVEPRECPRPCRQNSAIASRNWSGVMGGRPSALQGSCLRGVPPYFRRPVFAGLAVALLMRLRSWPTRDGGGGLKLVS